MNESVTDELALNRNLPYTTNPHVGSFAVQRLGEYPKQDVSLEERKDQLADLRDQLLFDLSDVEPVVAAYVTVRISPLKVHVWTLVDRRSEEAEARIATAERKLLSCFPMVEFDFSTIHLRERDPLQFIPEGAHLVKASRPEIAEYFTRATTGPAPNAPS